MSAHNFEGWPKEYIEAYLINPSDELYEQINDMAVLMHYGTPRHSGRYPWGSGKNPQRSKNWLQRADDLHKQGFSEKEIAQAFEMSVGDYRAWRKIHVANRDIANQEEAIKLHDKGTSNVAIAKKLGVSEGTVRNYLDPNKKRRENRAENVAKELAAMLEQKPYLDIGEGVECQLKISAETLKSARRYLEDQGYVVLNRDVPQVTNPKNKTSMLILGKPGFNQQELSENLGKVTTPDGLYFEDYGDTVVKKEKIQSVKANRIKVNYAEAGGDLKDGLIEIRPGVEDLSLGGRHYAQVRIGVNGTHYLKGMAVYGDPKKMPEGTDIVFNTSKHAGTPMIGKKGDDNTVLKPMKDDPTNPFGAAFRPWSYDGADGKKHPSPINIVNDDEDWEGWRKNLSSQFLSKQLPSVAKKQLDIRYAEMKDEFEEIKSLTNPTLKKQLLNEFADNCESAAVHLKAAALPRQGAYAILPVNSLKDNEVYAPMFKQGEEVILVRHPHEGVFQIPRLIVNNENRDGRRMIGTDASHAIGINAKSANQLSGADYDGDTVLVIPTKGQNLKTAKPLEGLIGYNPSDHYSRSPDDPIITGKSTFNEDGSVKKRGDGFNKGKEMGVASNLITDMTIKGADLKEIERAVKYSMCVIDAEKHNLDWKRCAREQRIDELKDLYQPKEPDENGNPRKGGGAATLISKARGEARIPERRWIYGQNQMTPEEKERWKNGELIYRQEGKMKKERKRITDPKVMTPEELERYNRGQKVFRVTGKIVPRIEITTNMDAVSDAYELSSGYRIENVYAAHANRMKALAQEARKIERATADMKYNKSAEAAFQDVLGKDGSLTKKLLRAQLEAPKERQAQLLAGSVMRAKLLANPELNDPDNNDKRKKIASRVLNQARDDAAGGHEKRFRIILSDREWEAIQAGAISSTSFKKVLRYADSNEIKKRAIPRNTRGMRPSTKSRARLLLDNGWTPSAVAEELGVGLETLKKEFNNFSGMSVGGDE